MTKVVIDQAIAERIRGVEGLIELIDPNGLTVGVVRRAPTEAEIARAKERASHGGETLTWAQVRSQLRQGTGE